MRLSVAIVVGELRHRAERAIRATLDQDNADQLEVIIVDLARSERPWNDAGPRFRVHQMPPSTPLAEARAAAVPLARGPLVAFLEEHTAPEPGWSSAIIAADDGSWAAAGVAISHGNPGTTTSDASYQASYGLFEPPVVAGEVTMLPGHNSVYRRDVLLGLGSRLSELLTMDTILQEVLRRSGHRLVMLGAGAVRHWNESTTLATWRGHWWFHRLYGARRADDLSWGLGRRLTYIVLAPLIPAYALTLWVQRRRRRGRPVWRPLLRLGPRMAATHMVSAVAQAVGLTIGEGRAQARFTAFELSETARQDSVRPAAPPA